MTMHPQGSDEWLAERARVITASECAALEGVHKYQKATDLVRAKVRALCGAPTEFKMNDAVRHGQHMEPHIKKWYEVQTGETVLETGLVVHPEYPFLGGSTDGLVGLDGLIEIKAPFYAKKPYSIFDADKKMYLWQVLLCMECLDTDWCDFVCYLAKDETVEPEFIIERVHRKEGWLEESVNANLLPQPRKGKIRRVDLFQAWHNFIHDQHQLPDARQVYLDPPKDKTFKEVEDDRLKRMSDLNNRIKEIKDRNEDDLNAMKELGEELETLKLEIAEEYKESVTNGLISVKFTKSTPPVDYKKLYEFLGGDEELEKKGESVESFRKTTKGYTSKVVEV